MDKQDDTPLYTIGHLPKERYNDDQYGIHTEEKHSFPVLPKFLVVAILIAVIINV